MGVVTHERAAPIHVRRGGGVRGESFKCRASNAERAAGLRHAAGGSPISMPGSIRYQSTALSVADQGSIILGIDIGASGAIALLTGAGELVDVFDMPVLADGPSGRRAVNAPLLAEIIFILRYRGAIHHCEARTFTAGYKRVANVGLWAFLREWPVVQEPKPTFARPLARLVVTPHHDPRCGRKEPGRRCKEVKLPNIPTVTDR